VYAALAGPKGAALRLRAVLVIYSPTYHFPSLGDHVFPMRKYDAVYHALVEKGGFEFVDPSPASWDELGLVHDADLLHKARTSAFSVVELARLELPWSETLRELLRRMTGGTIVAARLALDPASGGVAANIGGGFHHAFADHGEGFCLFNDVAVAIRLLQRERLITRAAVIDCDAHHGNGTAALFQRDQSVFTFSMHAEDNYPAEKPAGSLDIGLRWGVGDEEYLSLLGGALPKVLASKPDLAFYLAGGDVYCEDQIGGLGLSKAGARERDRLVLRWSRAAGVPVAIVLAGGYSRTLEDLVDIHVATFEEARVVTAASSG
jgi:acetoin utilization deacetylase AcuC-like enzyme